MAEPRWVVIASWHIVRTPTRVPNQYRTLCGRNAHGETFDERPIGKTCETCLRMDDDTFRAVQEQPEDRLSL